VSSLFWPFPCSHGCLEGFADAQLTDAIKLLAADPGLDPKVRRKLAGVLASWFHQFKNEPSMSSVANLYKTTRDHNGVTLYEGSDAVRAHHAAQREREREILQQRARDQQEAKERAKREKEEAKAKKAAAKANAHQPQRQHRRPFNFEQVNQLALSPIRFTI
jgi:seryl-tRNA synthetase